MAGPMPDYPPVPDFDKPVREITDNLSGRINTWILFPCRKRRDRYRVVFNGKEISKAMGFSDVLVLIRQAR